MPFVKGDPHINRKGRPKSFDKLRALAVDIAAEQAVDQKGNPILWNGKPVTNAELMLRMWLTDKKYQKDFAEVAFGKVPQAVALQNPDGSALAPLERNDERFNRAIESLAKAIGAKLPDPHDGETDPVGAAE